jgi:flagella basal body P-ring formation protein FlgA
MFSLSKKVLISLAGCLLMQLTLAASAVDTAASNSTAQVVDQGVDNKHILVSQAQRWVAEDRQLQRSMVEVAPSDRRLIIPSCDSPFEFNYPFATSQRTVRASCEDSGWQIFLGISIHQSENALRYTGSFKSGHRLLSGDIELVSLSNSQSNPIPGLAKDMRAIEGYSLNTAVRAGDLVMQRQLSASIEGYRLTRSVLAGETIDNSAFEGLLISSASQPQAQQLSANRLKGARAVRDLAAGKLLTRYDIKEKHRVLISQTGIARGQALTKANVAIQDYYGKLPQDTLQDYSSAKQMQAIRNLAVGSLLRLSDLTPIDIIRKGDNVQLSVRSGALEITVTMLALENARQDQRVLLLNPESGDEVQAFATGPGQARGLTTATLQ